MELDAQERCAFCGGMLGSPPTSADFARSAELGAEQPARRRGGSLALVVIVLLSFVALWLDRLLHSSTRGSVQPAAAIQVRDLLATVGREGGTYDVVASIDPPDPDHHDKQIGLYDRRARSWRWTHGPFAKVEPDEVVLGDGRLFVAEASRITSLRMTDGSVEWQTSFATELDDHPGHFMAVKDRVIALQRDGTVQAFDGSSGRLAWSMKFAASPPHVYVVRDEIAMAEPGPDPQVVTVGFHNPADGRLTHRLEPSCSAGTPDPWSRFVFSDSGDSMYALFENRGNCAQAWDLLAKGDRRWSTQLPTTSRDSPILLGERALVTGGIRGGLLAVETATGKVSRLLEDQDHRQFWPLFVLSDTIVVACARTWNSKWIELWGVDLSHGTRLWQFALSDANPFTHLGPLGLSVFQKVDDNHVTLDMVDPRTGVSTGQKVLPFGRRGWQETVRYRDDVAWFPIWDGLQAVNLAQGKLGEHIP